MYILPWYLHSPSHSGSWDNWKRALLSNCFHNNAKFVVPQAQLLESLGQNINLTKVLHCDLGLYNLGKIIHLFHSLFGFICHLSPKRWGFISGGVLPLLLLPLVCRYLSSEITLFMGFSHPMAYDPAKEHWKITGCVQDLLTS